MIGQLFTILTTLRPSVNENGIGRKCRMKNNLNIFKNLILLCSAIILVCVSFGCGGSNEADIIGNITDVSYTSKTVSDKGTLYLQTTSGSNVVVEAKEADTFPVGTEIILQERNLYSSETSPYGNISSKVYILTGTKYINGSPTSISNIQKPVTITIPNNFGPKAEKFYLAYKSTSASDWTYQMFGEDGYEVVDSARMSFGGPFVIETYHLDYCFTVFAVMGGSDVTSKESVKNMVITMASDSFEVNNSGQSNETYKEDLKISTKIESLFTEALFTGATVETEITFYLKNSTPSIIKVNGRTVTDEVDTKETSDGYYRHVLTVKNFDIDSSDSIRPVYSLVLNLKNCLTSIFPKDFMVKTTLITSENSRFAHEQKMVRILGAKPGVITWNLLEPKNLDKVALDSKIILKFSEAVNWGDAQEKLIAFNSDKFSKILFSSMISEDKTELTITPRSFFAADDVCRLTIATGIVGVDSRNYLDTLELLFKTDSAHLEPQKVLITRKLPVYDENVATATDIIFEFDQEMAWPENLKDIITFRSDKFAKIDFNYSLSDNGKTIVLTPTKPLEYSSKHNLSINSIKPKNSFYYSEPIDFTFTTLSVPCYEASVSLAAGSKVGEFANLHLEIVVDFGSNVLSEALAKEAIKVYKGTSVINAQLEFEEGSSRLARLTFPDGLEISSSYVVKLITTVKNVENVDIKKFEDFSFTTLPAITVAEIVPANNSTNLATDTSIYITFSGDIAWNSECEQFIKVKDSSGIDISCSYTYTSSLKQLCIRPEKLMPDTRYSVSLNNALGAVIGQETESFTSEFSTCGADAVMATITANSDWFYNDNVFPKICFTDSSKLVVDFVKKPVDSSLAIDSVKIYVNDAIADWNKNLSDTKLEITPKTTLLEPDIKIFIYMDKALKDENNADIFPFAPVRYVVVPFNGHGTEESRFQIETPYQIDRIRDYMKDNYELLNDISFIGYTSDLYSDYEDKGFKPIGNEEKPFLGSIKGNNFEISDLNINREDGINVGLIGVSSMARFDSIKLSRTSETNKIIGGRYVGVLVGRADYSSYISNCENNCEVIGKYGYCGSFVGQLDNGSKIISCCNNADMEWIGSNLSGIGGICGFATNESEISDSVNKGNITFPRNSNSEIAGIAGMCLWSSKISNCKNMGIIKADNRAAGICGMLSNSTVINCSNESDIYSSYFYGGGIIADGINSTISYCDNFGNVTVFDPGITNTVSYSSGICSYCNDCTISRCNNGNESIAPVIEGNKKYVGGICGLADYGNNIENCINYGSVIGNQHVGGIVGEFSIRGSDISESKKNLKDCSNFNTASGTEYVAGVCGYCSTYCQIENLNNYGSVHAGTKSGGIIGYAGCDINNSHNYGDVYSDGDVIGGVAGECKGKIAGCSNDGKVEIERGMYIGGVVGHGYANILQCYNNNVVSGNNSVQSCGGIAGGIDDGDISECFNLGFVNVLNGDYVGGIAGYAYGSVEDCYNKGNIVGTSKVGGIAGGLYSNFLMSCYSIGSVSGSETIGIIVGELDSDSVVVNCFTTGSHPGQNFVAETGGADVHTSTLCVLSSGSASEVSAAGFAQSYDHFDSEKWANTVPITLLQNPEP